MGAGPEGVGVLQTSGMTMLCPQSSLWAGQSLEPPNQLPAFWIPRGDEAHAVKLAQEGRERFAFVDRRIGHQSDCHAL